MAAKKAAPKKTDAAKKVERRPAKGTKRAVTKKMPGLPEGAVFEVAGLPDDDRDRIIVMTKVPGKVLNEERMFVNAEVEQHVSITMTDYNSKTERAS